MDNDKLTLEQLIAMKINLEFGVRDVKYEIKNLKLDITSAENKLHHNELLLGIVLEKINEK